MNGGRDYQHNFERSPPKDQPAKISEIWFIGFSGENLNVKGYDIQGRRMMDRGRMPSDCKRTWSFWSGELKHCRNIQ